MTRWLRHLRNMLAARELRSLLLRIALLGAALSGCAFTTTAKNWSGLNGANNQPTY